MVLEMFSNRRTKFSLFSTLVHPGVLSCCEKFTRSYVRNSQADFIILGLNVLIHVQPLFYEVSFPGVRNSEEKKFTLSFESILRCDSNSGREIFVVKF